MGGREAGGEEGVFAWELNTTGLNSLAEENISQFLPEFCGSFKEGRLLSEERTRTQ